MQIRTDILSGLIWVQNVCKDYQQTAKVATSTQKVNLDKMCDKSYYHMTSRLGVKYIKMDKPLVVYRFTGGVMTSTTLLRT